MKQYLNLCQTVLDNGIQKNDRTKTGTISCFGQSTKYDLTKGFPILTTKKLHFASCLHELLWFIAGDTNIRYLVQNNVRIWNEWPYKKYVQSKEYQNETMNEFISKIIVDETFAKKWGDLGPVYGKQWRNFNGIDQLSKVIEQIKVNPNSRRLIISSWNPAEVDQMLLPPCHMLMQFYVSDKKELSCQLYQRSADIFLGVPFNITSYSLLLAMIASVTGLVAKDFVHTLGDAHIYNNHIEQVRTQLKRTPKKLPKLIIKRKVASIYDYKFDDFDLDGYDPDPHIPGKVSV